MDPPTHPLEAPLSAKDFTNTMKFQTQLLKGVMLWCAKGTNLRHWRASYPFMNTVYVPEMSQGAPGKKSARAASGWDGISMDMYQPAAHVYNNPTPEPGTTTTGTNSPNLFGTLVISPRPTNLLYSTNSAVLVFLEFKVPVTVKNVIDLVLTQGRQYYTFHPDGSGCLFWQLSLLEQYVSLGWIDRAALDHALAEVAKYAKAAGPQMVPYPPVRGQFYAPK